MKTRKFVYLLVILMLSTPMMVQACPLQLELDVVAETSCDGPDPMFSVTATATESWGGWILQSIVGEKSGTFIGPTEDYVVTATWTKKVLVSPASQDCTCNVSAWIHGMKRNVSQFYVKPTGDTKHCHRYTWRELSSALKGQFKAMHGPIGDHGSWSAAYNKHIKENPGVEPSCVMIPPVFKIIYETRTERGTLDRPECGEQCGRCSNVFVGWVEWFDRDGGCDDDFYNERVEYPYDERCYENCQEGNTAEVQTFDSGWYDDGLPYGFGDWYANPQPPQFQRQGWQDQLRDYAGDVIDVNTQDVCWPYDDQDSRTVSVFEDEIAEKDPKIRTGSNCVKAWAWVRYFDPDGNKFVDGPRVYEFWTLSAYEPESVEILGKIVHKKDRCLLDIPEPPICPEGYSMVQAPVFNTETGQWEGLVCDQDCKPVPIIKYTIAGNFPCIYYGRTERGDTTEKLPYWIQDQIAAGGCDLLDRVGCDGVTSIPDAYWVGTGDFEAKYIDSCYTPPTCVGCDGKEVPAYNPLFPW